MKADEQWTYWEPNGAYTCGWCGALTPFANELVGLAQVETNVHSVTIDFVRWFVSRCLSCRGFTLVGMREGNTDAYLTWPARSWPAATAPYIPDHIKDDYDEARSCYGAGAYKATVAMARRAVQGVCVHQGANPKDRLYAQIDNLAEEQILTRQLKEMAHHVRGFGNAGAHPDREDPLLGVAKADADEAMRVLDALLVQLYLLPTPSDDAPSE